MAPGSSGQRAHEGGQGACSSPAPRPVVPPRDQQGISPLGSGRRPGPPLPAARLRGISQERRSTGHPHITRSCSHFLRPQCHRRPRLTRPPSVPGGETVRGPVSSPHREPPLNPEAPAARLAPVAGPGEGGGLWLETEGSAAGRPRAGHTVRRRTGSSGGHGQRRPTDLLQLLEVLAQEAHGALGLGDAQVHDAVLQHLLDAVPLHVQLAAPQALVLLQRGGPAARPWCRRPASCRGKHPRPQHRRPDAQAPVP